MLTQRTLQDLFSEIRAPPAAPSLASMGWGYPPAPQQHPNPSHPGAAPQYAVASGFPGPRPELPPGLPASVPGSVAFSGFGVPQYDRQIPAFPTHAGALPLANGTLLPQAQPQPLTMFGAPPAKLTASEGAPDPFSALVPGLKAALPTAAPPQSFSGLVPGDPSGFGSGFGGLPHAQASTNGQIPALRANPPVSFGGPSGVGAPGAAKSGNPFA